MFTSFGEFLAWLATPAGLAVAVVFLVGLLKRISGKDGSTMFKIGEWIRSHAFTVSVIVAAIVAALGLLIANLGVGKYLEPYWPTIILVYAVAQTLYTGQKNISRRVRELAGRASEDDENRALLTQAYDQGIVHGIEAGRVG